MARIRVGVVAYNFDDEFFREALDEISPAVDHITVVYGVFKGFDPGDDYRPIPPWLAARSSSPRYRIVVRNDDLPQHRQRDIYLEGAEPGDIIIVMDSDWMPGGTEFELVLAELRDDPTWDAALIAQRFSSGEREQCSINLYRYRSGWTHGTGQVLQDTDGRMIADPDYKIRVVDGDRFHWLHSRISEGDSVYRERQRVMWARAAAKAKAQD